VCKCRNQDSVLISISDVIKTLILMVLNIIKGWKSIWIKNKWKIVNVLCKYK
jgi:hypothetical protein